LPRLLSPFLKEEVVVVTEVAADAAEKGREAVEEGAKVPEAEKAFVVEEDLEKDRAAGKVSAEARAFEAKGPEAVATMKALAVVATMKALAVAVGIEVAAHIPSSSRTLSTLATFLALATFLVAASCKVLVRALEIHLGRLDTALRGLSTASRVVRARHLWWT